MKMLTEHEAAKLLGFKPDTLRAWRREGRNLPFYTFGRNVRYLAADLEAFIGSRRVTPDSVEEKNAQDAI